MSDEQTAFIITGNITTDAALAEIIRLRAENEKLRAQLDGRDQFIVENGLWSEFTKQVDKLTSAAAAALKETGG